LSAAGAVTWATESDEVLFRRYQAGDEDAFEVLHRRWRRRVIGHAYHVTRSVEIAEDIAQEAFLRVCRYRSSYDGRAKFSTWLYRIVRNAGLDYLRARRASMRRPDGDVVSLDTLLRELDADGHRNRPIEAAISASVPRPSTPEEIALRQERATRIAGELQRLPSAAAASLKLFFFGGYTLVEIAARRGVPLPTAKTHVYRGIRLLRLAFGLPTPAPRHQEQPRHAPRHRSTEARQVSGKECAA
jgi:RNA polymerase sigma-70 factor (ECF subfamily)